jgi:TonB-linked SusC/RagA family outer membrane protein
MKLQIIFLLVCCTGIYAENIHSQEMKVSIISQNSSIKDILTEIEEKTDYLFIYNQDEIDLNRKASVDVRDVEVTDLLADLFDGANIQHVRVGNNIVLLKNIRLLPQQNTITIKGTVLDEYGDPIIGANVVEKGTTNGIITDVNGGFSLPVGEKPILTISYIGYQTKEITVGNQTDMTIILVEDTQILEEIVVVGYGVQKKENLTGSVSAVNFKDVVTMPVANATNMLHGRLPGVVLTDNGSQAGYDSPTINIRGVGTFGNNDPMVLIDGVESTVSQMAEVPADDIETVSVLKDAASASIYGVRAANGVILITTKRGAEQKPSINYSGSFVLQQPTVLPDYVSSYEWAKMYNECWPAKAYTDEMLQKLQNGSDPDYFANTNWAKELFRTAPMHQHHLSVTGGSSSVHYMISVQYLEQEGILRETANQRLNFRSNLDAQLGFLKLGMNLSGGRQNIDEPISSISGDGLMRTLTWYTRPTVPVRYSNGHWGQKDGNPYISHTVFKNPIESLHRGYKDNKHYRFDGQFFGEIDILKELKFRSSLAYKFYMNDVSTFSPKYPIPYDAEGNALSVPGNNRLTDYHYLRTIYINENILTYRNSFGQHEVHLLAGHSVQESRWDRNESSRQGFATDNIYELNGGTTNDLVNGSAEENSLQSFFGRVNYNYDGRYLIEMNIRHDGSSRLPETHRYATFPSFSGAWLISNEKFMENIKQLNSLKVRASWGKLGNQEIGNYAYAATLASSGSYYFGDSKQIGMKTSGIPNENIRWEATTISDFGIDAAFWKGKISVTFDWYEKNTSDILMRLSMPGIFLGSLSAPYQNAGKVRNRGWEFSANYYDHKGDFSWQAGFSLSGVKNKIMDMKGIESISGNRINREGEAINSYYALKSIGIYRSQADLDRVNANGSKILQMNQNPQLGDIMYEDINNDGNINDADRVIIGNSFPEMQYSFNLGVEYKNFNFSTFWQGIAGIYRYNWDETTISNGGNKSSRWLNRWSENNPNGNMPVMGRSPNDTYSSFWLAKCDYLRLKSVEIGYTFNRNNFLNKLGVQNIKLYLSGANLLTFTSLKDYDPEKTNSDTRNDVHPNSRTYSFGINVKF